MDKKVTIRYSGHEVTRTLDVCTVADVLRDPRVKSDPDLQFGDNVNVRSNGVILEHNAPVQDGQLLIIEQRSSTKGC